MKKEVTQEELDNFLDKVLKYKPKNKNKDSSVKDKPKDVSDSGEDSE